MLPVWLRGRANRPALKANASESPPIPFGSPLHVPIRDGGRGHFCRPSNTLRSPSGFR